MMTLAQMNYWQLRIPFRHSFKHAAAERSATQSIWVQVQSGSGHVGYGEACPREYVTAESLQSVSDFIRQHEKDLCNNIHTLDAMKQWMAHHADVIEKNPSAWCALELAMLEVLAKDQHQSVEQLLGMPPLHETYQYTAVLGDMPQAAFTAMAQRYAAMGFTDYKIKLADDAEHNLSRLAALVQLGNGRFRLRLDANNLWQQYTRALTQLSFLQDNDIDFFAVEEPLAAGNYDDMLRLHEATGARMIVDESFLRIQQFEYLATCPAAWIVNVRVSKMGGLLRSLAIVKQAAELNIPVIVGAQVGETSLLTRAALPVATAAGDVCLAQEGAFGSLLLENDVCDPPLMFGKDGLLQY